MADFPVITLDATLTDLYKRASPKNAHKRLGFILTGVNSLMKISPDFPRNTKYIYQDNPFNNVPKDELTDKNTDLQRSLGMKYLSLVPQRDAFITGDSAIFMFQVSRSAHQIAHDKQEVKKTVENLDPKQKPNFVFCAGPKQIPIKENNVDGLGYKVVLDCLEQYPLIIPLDTHWYLNTKGALANSGLPTPKTTSIEVQGFSPQLSNCCKTCIANNEIVTPASCTGSRGAWLNEQADCILNIISNHPIPFVLKNQQTYGGAGTYVVSSVEDQQSLLKDLYDPLRKLLSQITEENHHLHPGTHLISEMVQDPIGDYGLTFFVTDEGGYIFLAASEQMIDDNRSWVGSTISYLRQDELEKKFASVIGDIAKWLSSYGYYGPVGADVLETAPRNGESKGKFDIVDLNVRTSGSMCLPLLRTHFTSRGCQSASSFSITVKETRDSFIEQWREKFEDGRLCIVSWYEDRDNGVSLADVAVGAEDEKKLQEEIKMLKDASDDVTF
ncbi:MAG: hypothetical protein M1821_009735 [Bathelium mastoideum]|nr:MAG: hypothetical protein M1821_009735 [Bathelium mastoideum]